MVETTPSAEAAARAAGLEVERYPLLVLGRPLAPAAVDGITVRLLDADDHELPATQAAVMVGFGHPGTAGGRRRACASATTSRPPAIRAPTRSWRTRSAPGTP